MPDQGVFRALQSVDFLSCQGFEKLQPGLFQNYAHMFHTGARAPAKVAYSKTLNPTPFSSEGELQG